MLTSLQLLLHYRNCSHGLITGVVRINPLSANASHAQIETHMKDWPKFASEQDEGKKMRAEKQCLILVSNFQHDLVLLDTKCFILAE